MEHVECILVALGDGEAHPIAEVRCETGCGPHDIEAMVRRGLIRPIRGHMLGITPRGVERFLRDKKHVKASDVARIP